MIRRSSTPSLISKGRKTKKRLADENRLEGYGMRYVPKRDKNLKITGKKMTTDPWSEKK